MYLPVYLQAIWWYKFPEIKERKQISNFIKSCKNIDGGYGNYTNSTSYLENVFYAIVTYSLINELDCVQSDTINYIKSCKCDDGGFGEPHTNSSNVFNTFYATISLKKLNYIDCELRKDLVRYVDSLIVNNRIYDNHLKVVNTTTLYWVACIMQCIVYKNENLYDGIVSFCLDCYDKEKGLFAPFPSGIGTIQNTYECLSILKQCSSLKTVDADKIYSSIIDLKRGAMYLDTITNKPTISTTMWAIECLSILNKINTLEQSDVFNLLSMVFSKRSSLYDLFCSTAILVCLFYENGIVDMDNTVLITEAGKSDLNDRIRRISDRLLRAGYDSTSYDFMQLIRENANTMNITGERFYQIQMDFENDRIYEIEFNNLTNSMLSLTVPMTRVASECINIKIINAKKVKLMGIFDSSNNLLYSRDEESYIANYCKNSNFYNYIALKGEAATKDRIFHYIEKRQDIFYISGHCNCGYIKFYDTEIEVGELINKLLNSHCSIIIFNCCDTYFYIKKYLKDHPQISENINIICTLNDVNDEQASSFIISFFHYLELCFPISEAVRLAKYELYLKSNGLGDTWLSYILFGNPFTLIENGKNVA